VGGVSFKCFLSSRTPGAALLQCQNAIFRCDGQPNLRVEGLAAVYYDDYDKFSSTKRA
jgi:hypothetical protein